MYSATSAAKGILPSFIASL